MTGPPEVFISYANSDGLELSRTLRACLVQEGITVWHEIEDMIGGERWQAQVEEALGQALFLVLVLTGGAVGSQWVAWEYRKARQHGVHILPIQPGDLDPARDFAALPQAIKARHIYNDTRERERLILHIKSRPDRPERVPFLAPVPPETYVQRTKEYMQLRALLLDERRENPVAITTALQGAGGFGKTTLAKALCDDDDIIDAFTDGILWVELGQQAPDVLGGLTSLYQALTGEQPGFTRVEQAAQQLAARLEDKTALIVIDDVWRQSDLDPFLRGGKGCARLFTTRHLDLALDLKAKPVEVDEMTADESIDLLRNQLGAEFRAQADPDGLRDLARRLGEWPQLLELAGGALNELMYWGEPFVEALATIQQRYQEKGVTTFDREDETQRRHSIRRVVEVSIEFLGDEDKRRHYRELRIFPEDTDIPLTTVAALWGLGKPDAKALAVRLAGLSLLKLDLKAGTVRLHDVLQRYLLDEVENQGDALRLHERLIAGWGDPHTLPDPYAWRHLADHLLAAGHRDQLRGLLLDDRWLRAKLRATDLIALQKDLACLPEDPDLTVLRRALDLSAHILARDKAHLRSQLYGRLLGASSPALRDLLDRLGASRDEGPWLRPLTPTLTRPESPLERTLEGHTGEVKAVAVTADGRRALSAGADKTVRVWDLRTGALERTLEGHTKRVNAVAMTADGRRALSAGADRTVRVWDLRTGALERTLEGHTGEVNAVAVTADGHRGLSAGDDKTVRVWDLWTGRRSGRWRGTQNGSMRWR